MKWHVVGGKGGVGKTTCAAMFALTTGVSTRSARSARSARTLLVTTDPASSLSDVLRTPVGSEPAPVGGWLDAAAVDAKTAFERWLAPRREPLAAIAVRGTYLDDEDVAKLLELSLPGIDEVIGLLEVSRMSAGYERVVVDTAPTGHTLRLLAAPALLGRVARLLDSLQSHHRTVVRALRGSYRADVADALIADLERESAELVARLRDPDACEITWVTLPEPMALEETSDAIDALERDGIHVSRLIINRVTPQELASSKPRSGDSGLVSPKLRSSGLVSPKLRSSEGGCAWCDARRRFEARALAPVARRLAGREILMLPDLAAEPRGIVALREAAHALTTFEPPAPVPAAQHPVRADLLRDADLPREPDLPPEGGSYGKHGSYETESVASGFSRKDPIGDLTDGVRWLLFGGKGGVGKSTCAAAVALRLAERRRVLLLSTDPAHSIGDVFGARFDNTPRAAPGAPSLHVREIDAAAEMDRFRERYIAAVDNAFARIARAAGDEAAFRDLIDLAPPGIDEVIAIADVADAIADRPERYDTIVTDTAPTGHALRLLQTPAVLRSWTQALMALLLKYREIVGAGALAALLVQLSKRLRRLQDVLTDARQTRFIVVTRATGLPAAETRDLLRALSDLGIAVGGLIVNASGAGTCPRCRTIARVQAVELGRLRRAGPWAIIETPAEVPPPHGPAALRAWGDAWRRIA